jgi:hypothetical protein
VSRFATWNLITRTSHRRAHRQSSIALRPPRCGTFADERRVVAGDGGGRTNTRRLQPRGRFCVGLAHVLQSVAWPLTGSMLARLELKRITRASHRGSRRPLRLRRARALWRVRPMSGASLPATRAAACEYETLIQPPRISKSSGTVPTCHHSAGHPTPSGWSSTSVLVPVASFAAGVSVWTLAGPTAAACWGFGVRASVDRAAAYSQGSRRSTRFARLERAH